ncbi:uncharacterized protein LOC133149876 [Syngnathus typhle]|uniref:uncharacterized protein LOC133149876 n=1 Tax=Syngnathus typhle TaxID=161592 RepID=UPI002A6B6127|nr:uncharacterized protein LOC133149876 [Syngnathus typhle]XP_061128059.1 uncharacterized protein LOC133149876 [Syngnathus typhle]
MDQANLTSAESDFLTNIDELDLQLLCDTPELDLSNINNDLPSTTASTSQIPDLVNIVNNAMQEGRDTDSPDIQAHLQAVVNELNSQNRNDGSQSPTLIPSQLLNMIAELNNQANGNSGRNSPDIPAQLLHMIQNLNTQPLIDRMTVNPVDHEIDASVITGNMPPSFQPNNCSVIIDHEIDVIDNNAPAFQDIAHQSNNNNASVITNQRGGSVVVNRPHFNNIEIRRHLNIPSQANSNDFATFYLQIEDRIDEVLREVDMQTQRGDVIQIELVAGNDRAHVYSQKSDINTIRDNVSDLLERLAQSNVELLADENLELIVEIVKPIRGGMRRRLMNTTNKEILTRKKRHLYIPRNKDNNLCFALSLTYLLNDTLTSKQAVRQARLLHQSVGLDCQTPVSLGDVHKFEKVLRRKITVMYRKEDSRPMTFFDTHYPKTDEDTLFVLHLENHYYGVKTIEAFMGYAYFCRYCYRGHENWQRHQCEGHCNICLDPRCKQRRFKHVICPDCNKSCRNEECFAKHKEFRATNRVSNCTTYKKCLQCGLQYYVKADGTGAKHRCPVKRCAVCSEILDQNDNVLLNPHLCYMQPIKPQPPCKNVVYYDFETYVDADGLHNPFLICCKSNRLTKQWFGTDCVDKFLTFFRNPRFKQTTFVAHNARGFDSYILIKRMLELGIKLDILMQGSKVLSFVDLDTKSRYIDSLSFLTMPLSAMPKALGLEDKSKGCFPHKFSSLEHLNYVGCHPEPTYYNVEQMSPSQRAKFDEWYVKQANDVFDFAKQALTYCENDVDLLMQGCEKFRSEYFEATRTSQVKSSQVYLYSPKSQAVSKGFT